MISGISAGGGVVGHSQVPEAALHAKALEMESAFLSEMLGMAGLKASSGAFGGGAGEEQFASFLRDAMATQITQRGGLGLAETIFNALARRAAHE